MIEHLKYKLELAKCFRQKEVIRKAYADDIRKALKDGKTGTDIQSLESGSHFEENIIDEEISILVTDYIIRKARRQFVEIPAHESEGMWEQCNKVSYRYVLTSKGISELRSSLRKERKEQVELVVMILTVLTGIIGSATGLVAVIFK
ncbi:hypothetical protein P0Y35_08710 [Kiritimatiellaeota bacterium B1221]|nr:hypothetical protein [Kiritimatiellaeota bacterium B1221]